MNKIKSRKEKSFFGAKMLYRKLNATEISMFAKQITLLLSSGVQLLDVFQIIFENTKKLNLKFTLNHIIKSIQLGESFYNAIKKYDYIFPNLFLTMVKVGENSGHMKEVMNHLAIYYEKEARLRQKLKNSLIYPFILIGISVLVFLAMFFYVIPKFNNIYQNLNIQNIPKLTSFLFRLSLILNRYFHWILGGIGIVLIFVFMIKNKGKSKIRDFINVKLPILGRMNQWFIVSTFTRALSTMYLNGISIVKSFHESVMLMENKYVRGKLMKANEEILQGKKITEAIMSISFFPRIMKEMIAIGEHSNHMEQVLINLANHCELQAEMEMTKRTNFIEPMIIICIAIFITFLIFTLFFPLITIMNQIMEG